MPASAQVREQALAQASGREPVLELVSVRVREPAQAVGPEQVPVRAAVPAAKELDPEADSG